MNLRIVVLILVAAVSALGQFQDKVSIIPGISFPTEPLTFYDYWKSGASVSLSYHHHYDETKGIIIAGEYNAFVFDTRAFMRRQNIDDRNAAIDGATTVIAKVYAAAAYSLPDFFSVALEPFIGTGIMFIQVRPADVRYSYYSAHTSADSKVLFCVPYGVKTSTSVTKDVDVVFEFKKNIGISREKKKNSDFSSIRMGIAFLIN